MTTTRLTADELSDQAKELARLTDIAELDLFSEQAKAELDAFALHAAQRFGLPVGLVSIVLNDSQYFAGSYGLEGWMSHTNGTPVEWSFCAAVVRTRSPYVVVDAATDDVQATNPLVTVDGVSSYAGTPLMSSKGNVLGSYCVIGTTPRDFTAAEMDELAAMARNVVTAIERRRH